MSIHAKNGYHNLWIFTELSRWTNIIYRLTSLFLICGSACSWLPLGLNNNLDGILSLGNKLETKARLRQGQTVGYHLLYRDIARPNKFQRRLVIGGAAGIGSGKSYVIAPEKLIY